jgi:hypothetical protein
MHEG